MVVDKHAGHAGKSAGSKDLWKSFVDAHHDLEMMESGKVKCKVTGHEMVATKELVDVGSSSRRAAPISNCGHTRCAPLESVFWLATL